MRYEIDQITFAVTVYDSNDVPFLSQPDYPNYDKFESVDEATAWALAFIEAQKADTLYYAPNGKNLPAELKPTQAEIDALMAKRFGNDAD
jgi:hypothetical protein